MGVLTNIYILGLLWYIDCLEVFWSPVIGSLIFIAALWLMLKGKLSVKQTFLALSYTVCGEILVHSFYLGYTTGFYYFQYLLILVFLLNYSWKLWESISFYSSMVVITFAIWIFDFKGISGLSKLAQENINTTNLYGTLGVILVVIFYFGRESFSRDKMLYKVNIKLAKQNEKILGQQEQQNLLIKEIHHRVKNNLQIISSLMSLQSRTVKDERVLEVLNESRSRVGAIAMIHQKLYQNNNVGKVDFKSYLADILSAQQTINQKLECNLKSEEIMLHLDIAVPLGIIVSELITNALKHAFKGIENPKLDVGLTTVDKKFSLVINDNGVGLKEDFNFDSPDTLGMEIVTALVDQIDGDLKFYNDNGACFSIDFQDKVDPSS